MHIFFSKVNYSVRLSILKSQESSFHFERLVSEYNNNYISPNVKYVLKSGEFRSFRNFDQVMYYKNNSLWFTRLKKCNYMLLSVPVRKTMKQ